MLRPSSSYHAEWEEKGLAKSMFSDPEVPIKRWQPHTVLLHDLQELDNDLGGRSDQDLALAGLLGVVDALKSVVENGGADHLGGVVVVVKEILNSDKKRGICQRRISC